MLKVRWIGTLLLAYLVSSSLQIDFAPNEDPKHEVKRSMISKETNEQEIKKYFGDNLGHFVQENDNANEGGSFVSGHNYKSNVYSNGPNRMKITYKKRTTFGNKRNNDKETNDLKSNNPEQKVDDYHISGDTNLLPLLLEYLNKQKDVTHTVKKDHAVNSDLTEEIKHFVNTHTTENGNGDSSKIELNRRNWNESELALNEGKENKPEENQHRNDIISSIQFVNTEQHKENEAHNSGSISGQVTKNKHQGEFSSVTDISKDHNPEGGERGTTYPWNLNYLDSDNKAKEASNSAASTHLDTSQIEFLVNNLCANSKKNLFEFWKQIAGYLKLNDENLSNQQKFELFLTILKKVNEGNQQNATDIVPSKPDAEVYVTKEYISKELKPTEPVKELTRSNPDKIQDLETNFNHKALSGPHEKDTGGIETEKILFLHKHKPDGTIKEIEVSPNEVPHGTSERKSSNTETSLFTINPEKTNLDQSPKDLLINFDFLSALKKETVKKDHPKDTTSDASHNNVELSLDSFKPVESNPDNSLKSLESPRVGVIETKFVNKSTGLFDNEDVNPTEFKTTPKTDLEKEKKQDDNVVVKINKDFKVDTEQIEKYKSLPDTPQTVEVDSRPTTEEEYTLLQDKSPERKGLNKHSLLDYLNAAITKEDTMSSEDLYVTKESRADKKTPNLIETNKNMQTLRTVFDNDDLDLESILLGLKDSEVSDSSKENNLKRILLLLHYFRSLPKDELAKIMLHLKLNKKLDPKLILKYNLALKNNGTDNANSLEFEENNTDELKALLQFLESQEGERKVKMQLKGEDIKDDIKLHPKLLLKYNLAFKNKVKDLADDGQHNSILKWDQNESLDEEKDHRPKLHIKWNLKQSHNSRDDLTNVLLEIIYRFKEYGISDKALSEIIVYLKRTLTENEGATECQAKELNEKLKSVQKVFENLLNLKKKAEAIKEV